MNAHAPGLRVACTLRDVVFCALPQRSLVRRQQHFRGPELTEDAQLLLGVT